MILQLPHPRAEMFRQRTVVIDDVVFLEDRERRERSDAGQRVAREAVRMKERVQLHVLIVEGRVHRLRRQHRGQRQISAREALSKGT